MLGVCAGKTRRPYASFHAKTTLRKSRVTKMVDIVITIEEQKAMKSLERLSKKWPETLRLFSWSGRLCVFKQDDSGMWCDLPFHADGISNDGGDPGSTDVNNFPDIEYQTSPQSPQNMEQE